MRSTSKTPYTSYAFNICGFNKKPHKQKLKGNLISQLSFDSGLRQWRRLLY